MALIEVGANRCDSAARSKTRHRWVTALAGSPVVCGATVIGGAPRPSHTRDSVRAEGATLARDFARTARQRPICRTGSRGGVAYWHAA